MKRIVYISACGTVLLFVLRAFLLLAPTFILGLSPFASTFLEVTIFAAASFEATLLCSMVAFWLFFDRSQTLGRTLWLLGMVVAPLLAIIYCFVVFRRYAPASAVPKGATAIA